MSLSARLHALTEGFAISVDSIRANKVRAGLTILGVAVGVMVVVLMSAAIHGLNASVAESFESAGPNSFSVNRFPMVFENCDGTEGTCKWLRNPEITLDEARVLEDLESVGGVVASTGTGMPVKYRDRSLPSVRTEAYSPNWLEINGGDIIGGRSFTYAENAAASRVMIVNEILAERLFGDSDPLDKRVTVKGAQFEVIGVYKSPPGFFSGGDSPTAIVPFITATRYLGARPEWTSLTVRPRDGYERDQVIDDVTAAMRGRRGLKPRTENNFAIITQEKLFEVWGKLTGVFFLVMLVLASIGLLVGGVGVVAIMMISVTERTREIGVRKALGATKATILLQFLIESVTLTGIGALTGLLVGWVLTLIIKSATPIPASIPAWSVMAALGASAFTGIAFGLLPAARAARLDPVEALRHE